MFVHVRAARGRRRLRARTPPNEIALDVHACTRAMRVACAFECTRCEYTREREAHVYTREHRGWKAACACTKAQAAQGWHVPCLIRPGEWWPDAL